MCTMARPAAVYVKATVDEHHTALRASTPWRQQQLHGLTRKRPLTLKAPTDRGKETTKACGSALAYQDAWHRVSSITGVGACTSHAA